MRTGSGLTGAVSSVTIQQVKESKVMSWVMNLFVCVHKKNNCLNPRVEEPMNFRLPHDEKQRWVIPIWLWI
jgi:hypothetical protein